jgi:hypothetical protein
MVIDVRGKLMSITESVFPSPTAPGTYQTNGSLSVPLIQAHSHLGLAIRGRMTGVNGEMAHVSISAGGRGQNASSCCKQPGSVAPVFITSIFRGILMNRSDASIR